MNFHIWWVIGSDNVVHCLNAAAQLDGCCLAWANRVRGERVTGLRQTWLVAIKPTKYTSHVLLPRLKIFFLVSQSRSCSCPWWMLSWPWRGNNDSPWWNWFVEPLIHHRKRLIRGIYSWPDQRMREFEMPGCDQLQWGPLGPHPEQSKCLWRNWSRLEEGWICIVEANL